MDCPKDSDALRGELAQVKDDRRRLMEALDGLVKRKHNKSFMEFLNVTQAGRALLVEIRIRMEKENEEAIGPVGQAMAKTT